MESEETIKKYIKEKRLIEEKRLVEDSKLLSAVSLIAVNTTKELAEASILLAKTTEKSADFLAKTTEKSVRWLKWLTVILIVIDLSQVVVAIIAISINLRLR